jgi:dTDP-4-amino-4,6-dideoxygalactose transaminase
MNLTVPFTGLGAQYARLKAEIDAAVSRVLASGYYIGGPEVSRFEEEFAAATGAPFAVGVANGTDAITLALRALGVNPGERVLSPAVSAYPTMIGVVQAGAVPEFVDVDSETGLVDLNAAEAALSRRTRAFVPVHLFGNCVDLRALRAFARASDLLLVEDCAQAHGASSADMSAGSAGAAAAWSFYPTKNLGAIGDAGAVTTSAVDTAQKLRRMRNYGQANRYEHVESGINSRLDPIQAAILSVKLGHLAAETQRRREIATRYDDSFSGLGALAPVPVPAECSPSRHLYPVLLPNSELRSRLQQSLAAAGIETLIHYPIALPDQPATPTGWRGDFPRARSFCSRVLSLPLYPDLTAQQIEHVVDTVRRWAVAQS